MTVAVNLYAVLVAAIACFILGFLWHGPLFGKVWLKLMKISAADVKAAQKQGMLPQMVAAFVAQLVTAYVMAHFVMAWGVVGAWEAIQLAFWVWLGFIVTVLLNGVLWEKRTKELYLFNIAYHLASLIVMTLILTYWQ